MQSTSVPDLQLRAAIASALYEQPIVLKKRSDPAIAQSLAQTIMVLNLSAWKTVQRDDLTEGEYLAGLRLARGAYALLPLVHTQLKPLTEGVSNTYAVALIRSGQYEAAITTLNKSIKSRGENPMDVAYLCLAQKRLGMTSEAEQSRDQLTKLMEIDSWRHNGEAQNARQEVDRAFDGAATAP